MPLTSKGEEIYSSLLKQYGGSETKAKQVLYAGKNKGTFTGIDDASAESKMDEIACRVDAICERVDAVCARQDTVAEFSTTDLIRLATELQSEISKRNS